MQPILYQKRSTRTRRSVSSKYEPHQGEQECARRLRQQARIKEKRLLAKFGMHFDTEVMSMSQRLR